MIDFGSVSVSVILTSCWDLSSSKLDLRFLAVDFAFVADSDDWEYFSALELTVVLAGFLSRVRLGPASILEVDLTGGETGLVVPLAKAPDRLSVL